MSGVDALLPQGIRYLVVGLLNTATGLCVIFLLLLAGLGPGVANALGFACGLAVSFVLNGRWTFRARWRDRGAVARFLACAAVCYALNLAVVLAAIRWGGVDPYVAQLGGVAVYTVAMFAALRAVVFVAGGG